jgi:hypothetical protein
MSARDGEQRKELDRSGLAGRIWRALPAVLFALMDGEVNPSPPPVPGQLGLADGLDKLGDVIGRGFCWLETKLGLRPKNWPTGPT